MSKSLVFVLALTLLAAPVLFGAGQKPAEASKEPIKLTGMVRDYSMKWEEPWTSAAKAFQQKHPNVTIELEGLPYDNQREKVLITVAAGKGPDIAQVDCIWLGEFASNKIIVDVSGRLAADPALRDDYVETFLQSAKWQGKDYGLWLWTDVRMLSYRKDFYRQAGLNPDQPPKTWNDLREYARKLNRPSDGVWGYAFPAFSTDHTADRFYPILWQGGGSILSPDYTKAAFNGPAGVAALQGLVALMNVDKVSPKDLLGISESDLSKGYVANKYAQMIKVGEFWSDYRAQGLTAEQYKAMQGVAPLPVPPGGKPATGSGGWIAGITRDSKHADLVWEYLKMVVDPPNMSKFCINNASLPVRKSMLAMAQDFSQAIPYYNVAAQVLPTTNFRPPIPEYTKISAELVTAIQKALSMEAQPKEALDQAARKADEILAARKW
jgi:multiple sugar transport system substrate-binding protein